MPHRIGTSVLASFLAITVLCGQPPARQSASLPATPPAPTPSAFPLQGTLPPAPEGVVDFSLDRLYVQPAGRRGLEFTAEARELNGKRVRLTGFMVRQTQPIPWCFLLSPVTLTLHEREYGLAEDLPATALHVFFPRVLPPVLPWERRPLIATGVLSLGNREEADGRISSARLQIDQVEFAGRPTLGTFQTSSPGTNTLSASKP